MNKSFERITTLEYRLKAANAQIKALLSGEKYVQMEQEFLRALRAEERRRRELEEEVARSHSETITVRNQWFAVFEDLEKTHARELEMLRRKIKQLEQQLLKAQQQRDAALDKVTQQRHHIYAVETALEEEKGKNLKLRAQLNRDYENSSIPSSKTIRHKKISNSRERSGRRPGAQKGHPGHGRKRQIPTAEPILLPPPREVSEDPNFRKTSKTIVKQLVNVRTILEVTEYHADVYYNSKTGERIHAEFPAGVVDDVNYGGSVKAFLLDNECCTSIDKSRKFLSDLTGGRLSLSKGMINKLSREFAQKTGWERNAMYFASRKKGHEGVKGTPVEDYQGILVHDHEKTFFHYGTDHQGCLAHVLRYLSHYRIPILYKRYINERFSIPLSSHASKRALSPPASIYFI